MKYLIGYKTLYIFLLFGNIYITPWFYFISGPFIIVHGFILLKILRKSLGPIFLNIDRVLSIGRMIMTITMATILGVGMAQGSPVLWTVWMPIMKISQNLDEYIGVFSFSILCAFLLALEIFYFWLLKKNRNELSKNLPIPATL